VSKNREMRGIFGREDGENSIVRRVMICTLTIGWECSTSETDNKLM
jgi:hypothetical protein